MFRPNISSLWARLLTASRGKEAWCFHYWEGYPHSNRPSQTFPQGEESLFSSLSLEGGGHTFTGAAQSVLNPKATKLINFSRKKQNLPVLRNKLGGYMASATS